MTMYQIKRGEMMFAGRSVTSVEFELQIPVGDDEATQRHRIISQEKRVEYEEVTTRGGLVPDPAWVMTTCACGREHRWVDRQVTHAREVATRTYWCDTCRDEHTDYEWRCDMADVEIAPGVVDTGPQTANMVKAMEHSAHVLISRSGEPWILSHWIASREILRGMTMWRREEQPYGPATEVEVGRFDGVVRQVEDNVATLHLWPA